MLWEQECGLPEGFHDRLRKWVLKELDEHNIRPLSVEMNINQDLYARYVQRVGISIYIQTHRRAVDATQQE